MKKRVKFKKTKFSLLEMLLEKTTISLIMIYPIFIIADIVSTYFGFYYFGLRETNEALVVLWSKYGYFFGSILNFIPLLSFLFISYSFLEKIVKKKKAHRIFLFFFFITILYITLLSLSAVINNILLMMILS